MSKGLITIAAALALHPAIASAQPSGAVPALLQMQYQSAGLPSSGEVSAFYSGWHFSPIWFNGNAPKPAVNLLLTALQSAPLDGMAAGPQYAAQIQTALQQAATGSPQAIAYAEHSLSEALVSYAQLMQQPVPGMTYGYDYMRPRQRSASDILKVAAAAPSLEAYIQQITNPNSIYTGIRDAAWQQMKASGSTVADPRVVANLQRARAMPAKGRFVMVNSATQMLYMYDNGVPVGSMKVVVGDNGEHLKNRPDTRTPLITSMMFYVIHNPYWNSSDTLNRLNIVPRFLAEGDSYFKSRGFKVMSDWTNNARVIPTSEVDWKGVRAGTVSVRIRQDPGPDNFMGQLKFPFANPQDIYLHDTDPGDRSLFTLAQRTRSNGCIRLENAPGLATWLLGHAPDESIMGPVMNASFGQTEAPMCVTAMPPHEHLNSDGELAHPGSCGRPNLLSTVEIMDEEGNLLPPGERGEIVVRGPLVMQGYYRNPEATAEVSAFGWHHTGDIGVRDEDGWFYVVDRKKDMIISGGFNVYPAEVEDALLSHPAVAQCAVIGIPDEKWGEAVVAFFEPRGDYDCEQIADFVRDRLGPVKTPKRIEAIGALPRTAAGKISRAELRRPYWTQAGRTI